jgi:hypothetical protein
LINIFKLLKYTWLDFRDKRKKEINGVYIFCGLYGSGKTLSLVNEAYKLKKQGYSVYSNIGLTFQDGHIVSWRDVINVPPNSVICLDEISNLVNSRDWKNMPPEFFGLLTQNRKLNIRIMATAQVYDDVDKQFRTLVRFIIQCNRFGRIIRNNYYNQAGYAHVVDKRKKEFSHTYVVENYMYDLYDTYEYVQKLKKLYT